MSNMKATHVSATDAKNEFGHVLDRVARGEAVVITRHEAPRAVIVSFDAYTALTNRAERALNTLSGEFDAAVARMQTPRARAALEAAFNASPARLGKAAVAAATARDAKPRRAAKT